MEQSRANRLKNILSGEYKKSTSIHSGYTPDIHKEGDEWEEDGKMYTIKNGIKCSISQYTTIRSNALKPLFCPNCKNIMSHNLDDKLWRSQGMCFDCVIKRDTKLMATGKFDEFQRKKVISNILAYLNDREYELEDYLNNLDMNQFITENGTIEDWVQTGVTKEEARDKILASYNNMKIQLLKSIEEST